MNTRKRKGWLGMLSTTVQRSVHAVISRLATVVIPVILLCVSFIAIFYWPDDTVTSPPTPLALRVMPDLNALSPLVAQNLLMRQPLTLHHDTNLSEKFVWFLIHVPAHATANKAIELPSRHLQELSCWDGSSHGLIGQLESGEALGGLSPVKAGFALMSQGPEQTILCRARFQGPAKLSANLWSDEALKASSEEFQRKTGLLDGAMMVMALLALIAAVVNRRALYLIFAAWVFLSLRLSATACGWDTQWFHHDIPPNWLPSVRSLTRAMWAIVTISLFKTLFKRELKRIITARLMLVIEGLCLVLLFAALIQSRSDFLVLMWWLGSAALLLCLACLVEIIYRFRTWVTLLYASSLMINLLSSLSEIWAASMGLNPLIGVLNTLTAALSACLLAAVAIAVQLRREHESKIEAQAQLRETYETVPLGLFTLDLKGRFIKANPAMLVMLGLTKIPPHTLQWDTFFRHDSWTLIQSLLAGEGVCEIEIERSPEKPDQSSARFLLKARRNEGKVEGSVHDITEKSKLLDELKFLAHHDAVTNTLNRYGLEQAYREAQRHVKPEHALVLAYLDLDRLKLFNELYGYGFGDQVLKHCCECISKHLTSGMQLSRLGEDTLVLLIPDTDMPTALLFCQTVLESLESSPFLMNNKSFLQRGFFGVIEVPASAELIEALNRAGHACREAKFGGKKNVVAYALDDQDLQDHLSQVDTVDRLANTNFLEGLFFEMQPILSLKQPHQSLNLEILLRMRDVNGRLIPINRVIAAGEQSGRIALIDCWVLSHALAWIESHQEQLNHTQFVCVNLSGSSLNDEALVTKMLDIIQMHRSVAHRLCVEITESVALRDLDKTCLFVSRVRALGVRVALDDFGAGYTSFTYLQTLSADILKIDGSFVASLSLHAANLAIVEAIVSLAKRLGMTTIAEWAEDAATVATLAKLGVDYVQGYVVASPMAPDQILQANSSASFVTDPALMQQLG